MTPAQREIAKFGARTEMTEIIPGHDPNHGDIAEFDEKTEMTEIIKVMTHATAKSPN